MKYKIFKQLEIKDQGLYYICFIDKDEMAIIIGGDGENINGSWDLNGDRGLNGSWGVNGARDLNGSWEMNGSRDLNGSWGLNGGNTCDSITMLSYYDPWAPKP